MTVTNRRFTFLRLFLALAIAVPLCFLCTAVFEVGQFYERLDAFSGAVLRGDQLAARDKLEDLKYFPELNKSLRPFRLDWVANKYFFSDFVYYEAAYDYLSGNYERIVVGPLKNDENFWAHYIRANSSWRLAQGLMEQSAQADPKDKINKKTKALEMASALKDDYEQSIKKDANSSLAPKWNYDLISDPQAMAKALSPKPAKIKVMLGLGGNKNKGEGQDKGEGPKGGGSRDLKIDNRQQQGKPRTGVHRPG